MSIGQGHLKKVLEEASDHREVLLRDLEKTESIIKATENVLNGKDKNGDEIKKCIGVYHDLFIRDSKRLGKIYDSFYKRPCETPTIPFNKRIYHYTGGQLSSFQGLGYV